MYSEAFKRKVVQRMLSPHARPMRVLAREFGVPSATLYRWRTTATLGAMAPDNPATPADNVSDLKRPVTAEEKLAVVLEAASVPEADLGAFLRRRGLQEAELREWRQQALNGLRGTSGGKRTDETRRVKTLERELQRKDKALAETAALLVLKKKVLAYWGDEDDDTEPKSDE